MFAELNGASLTPYKDLSSLFAEPKVVSLVVKKIFFLPSLILRCLNVLANCSNSSKSVVSSTLGSKSRCPVGVFICWGVIDPGVLGVNKLAGRCGFWLLLGGVVCVAGIVV